MPDVFFRFSYRSEKRGFVKAGMKWRKFLFEDHFDPTFGIETY